MRAFELVGDIDDQHRLQARVPEELPTGPVRLIVLFPDEDEAGAAWARGIATDSRAAWSRSGSRGARYLGVFGAKRGGAASVQDVGKAAYSGLF